MNKRLIIGLTLSAWCLYVASLFLPAADVNVGLLRGSSADSGGLEQGWEVLQHCVFPLHWIVVFPFVYLIVNVVFLYSAAWFWVHLIANSDGRKSNVYTVLASLSAVASLFAPLFVGGIGVGYFAWTASITLMAVATCEVGGVTDFGSERNSCNQHPS
jgi:hypothetical protein